MLALWLIIQQSNSPLLTNDTSGWARLLVTLVVTILLPVLSLVAYFLRKGPDEKMTTFAIDLTNIGKKVDRMEDQQSRDREAVIALRANIAEGQREIMEMLQLSAQATMKEIHGIAVTVARLEERGNVGQAVADAFQEYGQRIERVLREGPVPLRPREERPETR